MVMTMLMLCNPIDNLAKTAERRISCLRGLHRLWQTIKWPPSGLNFFFLRVAEGKEKLRVAVWVGRVTICLGNNSSHSKRYGQPVGN
jgi:hypothetical protein